MSEINKIFKKKNSFKGKIGIFDVHNNKIYHRLNFYEVSDNKLKKIFSEGKAVINGWLQIPNSFSASFLLLTIGHIIP